MKPFSGPPEKISIIFEFEDRIVKMETSGQVRETSIENTPRYRYPKDRPFAMPEIVGVAIQLTVELRGTEKSGGTYYVISEDKQ